MHRRLFALVIAAAWIAPLAADAADWPAKPVRVLVPYAPGGATDALGRLIAQQFTTEFKQQFYVENKPGNGGVTGSAEVARAAPDGHTLLISGVGSHVAAPAMNPANTPFDPVKDFTHIAMLGGDAVVLVATPSLGARSLDEVKAKAAAGGRPVTYGTPAVGSLAHLMMENFRKLNSLNLRHVAYRGGGEATTDLLGGHLQLGLLNFLTVGEHIKAGKLAPIAITGPERLKTFPQIPSFAELKHPEMVGTTWFAISGPKYMPPEVIDKIAAVVRRTVRTSEFQSKVGGDASVIPDMDIAAFNKFFAEEVARWAEAAKNAGLRVGQ
jgi:tripartite-type tricarboxylate transporter receptor subunit TctC